MTHATALLLLLSLPGFAIATPAQEPEAGKQAEKKEKTDDEEKPIARFGYTAYTGTSADYWERADLRVSHEPSLRKFLTDLATFIRDTDRL